MTDQLYKITLNLIVVLSFASCTGGKMESKQLRVNIPAVKIIIDPHKMEDMFSMMITLQLYRGLLRYDAGGEVKPDLADGWHVSSNKLVYRFNLKSASFSDGKPVTSHHVQMSFARMFLLGSSMAADIDYIMGARDFQKTQDLNKLGVVPVSSNIVEFRLSHPSALFLKHLAVVDCSILPIASFKEDLLQTEKGVFSGPYKLTSIVGDSEFHLEKWRTDSLDSLNPPKKLIFFKSNEKPIDLAAKDQTDSLDYIPITNSESKELEAKKWIVSPTELTGETFVILNPKFIPKEAREYLYKKINPHELVSILAEPKFRPAFGLIPSGIMGELSDFDVKDLKQGLASYNGKKIIFNLDYELGSERSLKTAEWLKKNWDSEKIEVTLKAYSKGELLQRMFEKTAEATIGRKGIDYPDGFSVLTYFKGQYASNYFHVQDEKIDKAIAHSVQEFDLAKRTQAFKEIQKMILRHYTNIPLVFGSQASGFWSAKVKSIPSHPMGIHTMPFEVIEMKE